MDAIVAIYSVAVVVAFFKLDLNISAETSQEEKRAIERCLGS